MSVVKTSNYISMKFQQPSRNATQKIIIVHYFLMNPCDTVFKNPLYEMKVYFVDICNINTFCYIYQHGNFFVFLHIRRDPQILQPAKSQKNLITQENCEEHVLNQIKHINVGFHLRNTRNFL